MSNNKDFKDKLKIVTAIVTSGAITVGISGCGDQKLDLEARNKLSAALEGHTEEYLSIDENNFEKCLSYTDKEYLNRLSDQTLKEIAIRFKNQSLTDVKKHLNSSLVGLKRFYLNSKTMHSYGYDPATLSGVTDKNEKICIEIHGNLEKFVNNNGYFDCEKDDRNKIIEKINNLAYDELAVLVSRYKLDKNGNIIEEIIKDTTKAEDFYTNMENIYDIFGNKIEKTEKNIEKDER